MTKVKQRRVPYGEQRSRLTVDIPERLNNYHLRWVNDQGNTIGRLTERGYEFVTQQEIETVGETDASQTDSGIDSRVSRVVNSDGTRAYLMKIRRDWYEQDQKAKAMENEAVDDAIHHGALNPVDKQYVRREHKMKAGR